MSAVSGITLMSHQEEGVRFLLARRSGILAFEQGLGKTVVALEAYLDLRGRGLASLLVVICPNSLKGNWRAETSRFAPGLTIHDVGGPPRQRRMALWDAHADVYLISYETLRKEITSTRALLLRTPSVLILDESHYVKNWRSLNSIAARHLAPCTPFRWLLTGTPVTNSPDDIYPQIALVADPNPLGSFPSFSLRFSQAAADPDLQSRLLELISPHLMRRTKEECLDLPSKTFVDLRIALPPWQRQLYDAVRDGFLTEVRRMNRSEFRAYAPTALVRLLRLSQIASNHRLLYPDDPRQPGKLTEMDRIVEDLVERGGRKVIIWSHYVATLEELVRRYERLGVVSIYGAIESSSRIAVAERFQHDPAVRLLIGNPAAAGTGFTLTAATYTIYETLTWRYDYYAQSQDRNHRIGQSQPVIYLRLIAEETIEEAIAQALARKESLARGLVGDPQVERFIARMGPDAFCSMLVTGRLPE